MADDPRERIETEHFQCRLEIGDAPDAWEIGGTNFTGESGYADWPEVVAFARAILAADEAWKDSQTPKPERQFPVLNSEYRPGAPKSVPWSILAPHEPQALKNHCGQSLETLARRGGLSPVEIYAVVNGLSWSVGKSPCDEPEALRWLAATLAEITPVEGREEVSDE